MTNHLTRRQREVLQLLTHGKSNKEIARALSIAEATTKIHMAALVRALGAPTAPKPHSRPASMANGPGKKAMTSLVRSHLSKWAARPVALQMASAGLMRQAKGRTPGRYGIEVTAQVVLMGQQRRRDIAKFEGSRVRASMMFHPCFLAVEKKERMSAKSIAPCGERKPPEIFCRSFIMRPSRSA